MSKAEKLIKARRQNQRMSKIKEIDGICQSKKVDYSRKTYFVEKGIEKNERSIFEL